MAKSSYLSNSAKLFSIVASLLFAANALSAIGSFLRNETLVQLGVGLSSLSLYVVLVLGYVALNGEGVAHKRYRDRKSKRITGFFKFNLFFCFVLNFIKGGLVATAYTFSGTGRIVAFVILSVISTVGSYGFVLCGVSFWYILRDKTYKKLLPVEIIAFAFGVAYNLFKLGNYAFIKYRIPVPPNTFTHIFADNDISKLLCLLQFGFDIIMFAVVCIYFGKMGEKEQNVLDNNVKELPRARNVYKEEGFGIDTLEDDFLIDSN